MKLTSQGSSAVLDSKGAYLSSLTLGGLKILLETEDGRQTHGGACNLIPYAGRIRKGTYSFMGRTYRFPTGEDGNSIHGFAREAAFEAKAVSECSALFTAVLEDSGYPSTLDAALSYELSETALLVSYDIRNTGSVPAPLVIGSHPYFLTQGNWKLTPASNARKLQLADGYFPDGTYSEFDFAEKLYEMQLDTCFEGGGELLLSSGRGELSLRRKNMDFFLVYNGRYTRGESVAVEPITGAPDAYNNSIGLRVLAPGEKFSCSFTVEML